MKEKEINKNRNIETNSQEKKQPGRTYKELNFLKERISNVMEYCGNEAVSTFLAGALQEVVNARAHMVETAIADAVRTAINETGLSIKSRKEKQISQTILQTVLRDAEDMHKTLERISLSQARFLMEEIEREAERIGVAAVIAVADKGARTIAVHAMNDSYIASFDIALNKAYTSAALKMSTMQLKTLSQPGGELYGIQHTNGGKIVIFGGGEPLFLKENLLGGLGVSGGTESQDAALAAYGKEKFKEAFS
ncbi:heme-binding protein [Anaerocolumna sp. AGMB13020]|uniref:GlcG/HbpS family heme-binding protein n=1 Tax=Anaerocolumna sp. AGMB13020 TaxID=3081750 RepID=UPI0029546461|nr:heme-binding protein [Anaerocolumna sp. AGMB13020]WOO37271.1 heme-binding protein [Anaerocolumna sp. AGMB13020]